MDLDITMVFPVGSTFVFFGSWICTVDDSEKLQSHLVEISAVQAPKTPIIYYLGHTPR